ncbi:DUF1642 domain-containing protein [Streptococcus milleri]
MNKQEVLKKLGGVSKTGRTRWVVYDEAKELIEQIDELEKPVIPNFIATELEATKMIAGKTFLDLASDITLSTKIKYSSWIDNDENARKLALAWFYGYEVEKEKLYTARLKLVTKNEEGYLNKQQEDDRFFIDGLRTRLGDYQTSFTRSELEDLDIWSNPAFEIKEVE